MFWKKPKAVPAYDARYAKLLDSLEFRNEEKFQNEADAYFKWVHSSTSVVAKHSDDFITNHSICSEIISLNSTHSVSLSNCLADSSEFMQHWREIRWATKQGFFGGRGFERSDYTSPTNYNRQLLETIIRHVESDEFKTRKVKLARRDALLSKKVFIVHGHDHEARDLVSDMLKQLARIMHRG